MPQVAARINTDQERWLKDYFRTKSAGAEFILPWAVDTFFRAINAIKKNFTNEELMTLIEIHKDTRLQPDNARSTILEIRVSEACDNAYVHEQFKASKSSLLSKISHLNDTEAAALMVWASAYWVSRSCAAGSMEEYIQAY